MAVGPQDNPGVSVVVIGRNEGERLATCLESIRAMDYPAENVEVIYVDSNSTDNSVHVARMLGAVVKEVDPERPCAAVGRNAGWRAAENPFVLFLDGDTVLQPDFVRRALHQMDDERVAVVCGHRRELHPEHSIYNRVIDLDWIGTPGPCDFCGGDALVRRSVLESVGGYDDALIAGEEPDMCARMRADGHTILYIDVFMTGHDLDMRRFSQYWKRAVRAGHAYREVSDRFRDTGSPLWSREARRNVLHAGFIGVTALVVAALTIVLASPFPLLSYVIFWGAVVVRSAHRARWSSASFSTRLLFAIHSHFQQVPILFGQLTYVWLKWRGRRQKLIDYKEPGVRA